MQRLQASSVVEDQVLAEAAPESVQSNRQVLEAIGTAARDGGVVDIAMLAPVPA